VGLERARPRRRHGGDACFEFGARHAGARDEFEPRHLGVDVREVAVTTGEQLVDDVHGPGRAALGRHGDEDVVVPPLQMGLHGGIDPGRGTAGGIRC
jgi:hypothetical protein